MTVFFWRIYKKIWRLVFKDVVNAGPIYDEKTGLEWIAGPDKDTNYHKAKSFIDSLGEKWRFPTLLELDDIYLFDSGNQNMRIRIKTTGWAVWHGEELDNDYAGGFNFEGNSNVGFQRKTFSDKTRVFAVRKRG